MLKDPHFQELIEKAREELSEKGINQIQFETSLKWAARAVVAYENSVVADTASMALSWLEFGNEYAHEAMEHAALVEGIMKGFMTDMEETLNSIKNKAWESLISSEPAEEPVQEKLEETTSEDSEQKTTDQEKKED